MSELNNKNDRRFGAFDNMSIAELEEILRQNSELSQGEEYDMGAIIYISELIAKREMEQPTGRFTDINTAWKSFKEDYSPIPWDGRTILDDEDELSEINTNLDSTACKTHPYSSRNSLHSLARVASVAVIVVSILFFGTVTSYAMGFDLWGVIARWSNETFSFVFSGETGEPVASFRTDPDYCFLREAVRANNIEVPLVPTWLPKGFEQTEFQIASEPRVMFYAAYTCGGKSICIGINEVDPNGTNIYQKDEKPVAKFVAGGVTHYIMSNLSCNKAIWTNENFVCSISGDISIEKLEKMIESIYKAQ